MNIKELAKDTSYTSDMQRYYLACIDEFGEELRQFVEELCSKAYDMGYKDSEDGMFE